MKSYIESETTFINKSEHSYNKKKMNAHLLKIHSEARYAPLSSRIDKLNTEGNAPHNKRPCVR